MTITQETVQHVAKLARLELTEAEAEKYTRELAGILTWVEQLNELDLSQIDVPMTLEHRVSFREDEAQRRFQRDDLLKNAPEAEDGFFRVPRILETKDT